MGREEAKDGAVVGVAVMIVVGVAVDGVVVVVGESVGTSVSAAARVT